MFARKPYPHRHPSIFSGCKTHLFCKECAEKTKSEICPSCRAPGNRLVPLGKLGLASVLVSHLVVTCPENCGESFPFADLTRHYRNCSGLKYRHCNEAVLAPATQEVRLALIDFMTEANETTPRHSFLPQDLFPHHCKEARFKCRYQENGCPVVLLKNPMNQHKSSCEFRPVKCDFLGLCKHEVSLYRGLNEDLL